MGECGFSIAESISGLLIADSDGVRIWSKAPIQSAFPKSRNPQSAIDSSIGNRAFRSNSALRNPKSQIDRDYPPETA
jgi:hypothetical protein